MASRDALEYFVPTLKSVRTVRKKGPNWEVGYHDIVKYSQEIIEDILNLNASTRTSIWSPSFLLIDGAIEPRRKAIHYSEFNI